MSQFGKPHAGGFMDQIRCDEPSFLIWKWHPAGSRPGENDRENAIRWGSSLRVKDGEAAVFVYNQPDGKYQDFIEGPFDQIIETRNLPVLASIVGLAYDGGTPFQAEIYFINLAQIIQIRFGVPFFDVYDPRYPDFGVPVAVRGNLSFHISDYRRFVKLHRLVNFDLNDFRAQVQNAIVRYVKDAVANAPAVHNIPLVQIETKTAQINDAIEYDISERLKETFGVTVTGVDIGAIELDKTSEGYAQLIAITRTMTAATVRAQTEVTIKQMHDLQRIEAENYQETLRIQREEGQYAQHKQTQSANMGAFQVEKQADVGIAGANALGQMGANGAGSVDLGGSGGGFNPAAMMAGMALGGAVGQNLAGTMNQVMGGKQTTQQNAAVPPPIPSNIYHVAVNGQATGPFDLPTLMQMAAAGNLSKNSLVWTPGMINWAAAGTVEALNPVFSSVPPAPPKE